MHMKSDEYKAKLHLWNLLTNNVKRTPEQDEEKAQLNDELHDAELAYWHEVNAIAMAASDYDQVRTMGDLGGVEVL